MGHSYLTSGKALYRNLQDSIRKEFSLLALVSTSRSSAVASSRPADRHEWDLAARHVQVGELWATLPVVVQ